MQPALRQRCASSEVLVLAGDCRITADPHSRLITPNLDTCVAVAVYVPKLPLAALLRFRYPRWDFEPSEPNPWLFAETAIPLLFHYIGATGMPKRDISVYAIGGASDGHLPLGRQNVLAMRRLLWKEGVLLSGEDTGGRSLRSLWLEAGSGRLIVRTTQRMRPPLFVQKQNLGAEESSALCHSAS